MNNWIDENGMLILSIFGLIIGFFITVILVQFVLMFFAYLLKKRILLVSKKTFNEVLLSRDAIESKENSIGFDHINSIFETISEIANHKDKLVKATGESLKKLDTKIDNMSNTIATLEELNKKLRNREEVISKLKTIKLLITAIEEIDKFIPNSKENYLQFIRDNIETILIGLGVEPYRLNFINDNEFLKYHIINSQITKGEIKLIRTGYYITLPDGIYVVKQAQIEYLEEVKL